MFDEVYTIAIESDNFEQLKEKLTGLHIDDVAIKNGFFVTAAAQLAREGQDEKVEWMRQLGANINWIAFGYTLVADHDKVDYYRTQHSADVNTIAQGYARAGNHDKVDYYRTQLGADATGIAVTYILAGNHDKVDYYRTQLGVNATGIAVAYILVGNNEKVEFYHSQHGADVNTINTIAQIYARTGNHEKVEYYRTQHGADVNMIARGYALTGNHEKQKKYDINCLLDSYLRERGAVTDSSGRTKEYFYGSFFSAFQKSFTQKSDAVNALKSALKGELVDLSEHLPTLRNGHLGKELRAFVKSGMANALVGTEVTTVSGFVQALQDKVSNQAQPT